MCINPITIPNKLYDPKKYNRGEKYRHKEYTIPCGKCVNCLSSKANSLAMKIAYNYYYKYDKRGIFITLTYSDTQVPMLYQDTDIIDIDEINYKGHEYMLWENGKILKLDNYGQPIETLRRKDFQLFMKKFRKEIYNAKIYDKPLCFIATSEYGDKGERPHYHAVILGVQESEEVKQLIRKCWQNENGQIGLIDVKGLESPKAIFYVAKYTMKELEWKDYDPREKPKVWHSIGIDKAIIEKVGIEKLKKENWNIKFGQQDFYKVSFGNYYIKKWHGSKKMKWEEVAELMENQHVPKVNHSGEFTLRGYSLNELKQFVETYSRIQEKERKEKLQMKGQKFSRKINSKALDISDIEEELQNCET